MTLCPLRFNLCQPEQRLGMTVKQIHPKRQVIAEMNTFINWGRRVGADQSGPVNPITGSNRSRAAAQAGGGALQDAKPIASPVNPLAIL